MVENNAQGDGLIRNSIYATFRKDKPADPGHSPEIISTLTARQYWDNHSGMPDHVEGCKTIIDYFERQAKARPNYQILGTRTCLGKDENGKVRFGDYAWKSYAEV